MIALPLTKTRNGCYYRQVHRTAGHAIYSMSYSPKPDSKIVGFDVFKIMTEPDQVSHWNDKTIPAHERFPYDNEYGKSAWSFTTQRTAMEKLTSLELLLNK